MSGEPVQVYTPQSFLEAEYKRIESAWFWRAMIEHLRRQMQQHTDIAFASASADEKNLRVAAAMASAFKTALELPELIRSGKLVLPNQIIGPPPPRRATMPHDGDDDAAEAS